MLRPGETASPEKKQYIYLVVLKNPTTDEISVLISTLMELKATRESFYTKTCVLEYPAFALQLSLMQLSCP